MAACETASVVRHISELFQQPAPELCALIGRGPSLDEFDETPLRDICTWGINNVAIALPDVCDYAIWLDRKFRFQKYADHICDIRRHNYKTDPPERGYWFDWQREIAPGLRAGTAPTALCLLARWGVKRVWMVGFDGYDRQTDKIYADRLHETNICRHNTNYSRINAKIATALADGGIEPIWQHRGETP